MEPLSSSLTLPQEAGLSLSQIPLCPGAGWSVSGYFCGPKVGALHGNEIVDGVTRLCAMNLLLHGVGPNAEEAEPPIETTGSLIADPGTRYRLVLTNLSRVAGRRRRLAWAVLMRRTRRATAAGRRLRRRGSSDKGGLAVHAAEDRPIKPGMSTRRSPSVSALTSAPHQRRQRGLGARRCGLFALRPGAREAPRGAGEAGERRLAGGRRPPRHDPLHGA
jgi:hypothetical protein